MGEHSGRYKRLAHELLTRVPQLSGIASYDMRGHGKSTGERGSCSTLDEYVNDFKEHVSVRMGMEFGQGVRCIVGGHSLGGMVAAECVAGSDWLKEQGFGEVVGCVLSAPAVECVVSGVVNRMLVGMAGVLVRVPGVRGMVKDNGIEKRKLTHSAEEIEKMEKDEHMYVLRRLTRVFLCVCEDVTTDFFCYGVFVCTLFVKIRANEWVGTRGWDWEWERIC